MQLHHAVCDGKGVLQVFDDFLRGYARAMDGDSCQIQLAACDEALLAGRGKFGLTARKLLKMLPAQLSGLLARASFCSASRRRCCRASKALIPLRPMQSVPAVRTVPSRGRHAAGGYPPRRPNSALRSTIGCSAISSWRLTISAAVTMRETDWLRFSVPINLRQPEDARLPAANVGSMVFLDRRAQQIADPANLLRGIHEEMDLIRRRQLGLTFIWSLHALRPVLPGGLAGRVGNGRCEATCVVSNLGRALADCPLPARGGKLVAGNLLLEGVEFFGPVREGTTAILALVFYAGELHICLRYDSRRITAAQADDLLTTYLQTVRASLGELSPHAATKRPEFTRGRRTLESLAQLLALVVGGLVAVQAALLIGYVCFLCRVRRPLLADGDCPRAAVILCVRGLDPFLAASVKGLLRQDYPRYDVWIVVDSVRDPAWPVVNSLVHQFGRGNVRVLTLTDRLATSTRKVAGQLQALAQLDTHRNRGRAGRRRHSARDVAPRVGRAAAGPARRRRFRQPLVHAGGDELRIARPLPLERGGGRADVLVRNGLGRIIGLQDQIAPRSGPWELPGKCLRRRHRHVPLRPPQWLPRQVRAFARDGESGNVQREGAFWLSRTSIALRSPARSLVVGGRRARCRHDGSACALRLGGAAATATADWLRLCG